MKTKKAELDEVLAEMQAVIDKATEESRDLSDDEAKSLEEMNEKALELKATVQRQEKGAALIASIGAMKSDTEPTSEHQAATGNKGFLGLSGKSGKVLARQIASQIHQERGAKAFLTGGTVTTTLPLLASSPIELGKVPTSILDILSVTRHDVPVWKYLRQTVEENNAAIVAPGALKPTSVVTLDDVDGKLEVFAHLSEYIDEYLLADNNELGRFLNTQLLYMLQVKVEDEVLNGDGTTGHLRGILNTSGLQTQAFASDKLTTLRTAALKLENLGYTADAFVVNIADWAAIETQRATSGAFDLGGPIDRAAQKVWGTQVVTSSRIAAGTALALDLDAVGFDTDTAGINVKWDTSTGFDKNQVRARVEGRFGVSVFQPSAIVKATLTGE